MKTVLIIGSLNMDASIQLSRFPASGETVMGQTVSYTPGGKGANQAVAAGKLASEEIGVNMIGCVGSDNFGLSLLKSLREANVNTSYIRTCHEATGLAVVMVDQGGKNQIIVVPGSNSFCDINYLSGMETAIQEADYVLFQLEIPHEAVYYGIRRAKELGKTILLNPAPAPEHIPDDILSMVDYLTPNERELLRLSGSVGESIEDYTTAAQELLAKGVANVIVTLGSQGALIVNRDMQCIIPAQKVHAVDTTAAGDCFNAAMIVALAEGKSLLDAVRFANTASAISVTRRGAQKSLPDRIEVTGIV